MGTERGWGPGPVFVFESVTAARRWQGYALRSLFVFSLLLSMWAVWESLDLGHGAGGLASRNALVRLGEQLYYGVASVQISLVLLAAPAATAGAICLDRARGALTHLFVTDLSNTEIVLGKLGARLLPVVALVAAGVPVLAISTLLGGIIPEAIVTLTVVTASTALFSCSLAIVLSTRASKTHEVLMAVYAIEAAWLLAVPVWEILEQSGWGVSTPRWFIKLNPFALAFEPYYLPARADAYGVAIYAALAVGLSALMVAWAVIKLRADVRSEGHRSWGETFLRDFRERYVSWWPVPSLDANPVLWREWHRHRPSRLARRVRNVYVGLVVLGLGAGITSAVQYGIVVNGPEPLILTNLLGVVFGLLLLSATAPTVLSEERVRGSLDVLISTPLPTRAIVMGKWWAVVRRSLPIVLIPAVVGLFFGVALPDEPWSGFRVSPRPVPIDVWDRLAVGLIPAGFALAYVAALASLGLALATWIKSPGRAVALSVSAYLFMGIGWMFLTELVIMPVVTRYVLPLPVLNTLPNGVSIVETDLSTAVRQVIGTLSPIGGQISPFESLQMNYLGHYRKKMWLGFAAEVTLVFAWAAAVLCLTLATFNRCMGRVNEQPGRPRPAPAQLLASDTEPVELDEVQPTGSLR